MNYRMYFPTTRKVIHILVVLSLLWPNMVIFMKPIRAAVADPLVEPDPTISMAADGISSDTLEIISELTGPDASHPRIGRAVLKKKSSLS